MSNSLFAIECARAEDAAALLEYLKIVGGETENLSFGAEGVPLSLEVGRVFASSGQFEKSVADAFAAPEYMSKKQIRVFNLLSKYISRLFLPRIAKKLECKEKPNVRPLDE